MVRRTAVLLITLLFCASAPLRLCAQVGGPLQPPTTGGLPALLQELQFLGHNKRVLMIGAHPDDEDTQLLVLLTRREGAEAAYLSLTRGEGGQNLIGTELGEALGILRTEELMAARNVDGAQQFFTRAYDFGFSKTLDDTWAHWPKDSVLKDVVRIVRRFRPQVIVAVFSGTPRDGHGQHQASGWAAAEAYRVAGDPNRFPELKTEEGLEPWTPTKLYVEAWFNPQAATLTLDAGEVEKLSGKTYHQLAMAARSLHRSQDMGQIQDFGPSLSRLTFGAVRGGTADVGEGWGAFWSGVDTVLRAPSEHFAALAEARTAAGRDPLAVGRALRRAYGALAVDRTPDDYLGHLSRAREIVSWVFVDAIVERARVAFGGSSRVELTLRNAGGAPVDSLRWRIYTYRGSGWERPLSPLISLPPGRQFRDTTTLTTSRLDGLTNPYYLNAPRVGDQYEWRDVPARFLGSARGPEVWVAGLLAGDENPHGDRAALSLTVPVSERVRDQAFGEIRRPVVIVPPVSVKLSPEVAVVRTGATGDARTVTAVVALESGVQAVAGNVTIEVPDGWPRPVPVSYSLNGYGATAHVTVQLNVPAGVADGQYPIRAVATDAAGQRYDIGAYTIDYPHIRPRQYTKPATARIEVIDLTPPLARNIAYVRGAADKVPEALAAAGLHVTLLDSVALSSSDLSGFDAIIIGPRAYEVDSAVVRNNQRLNDYARDGGRVIVQYQQQVYLEGGFAPYRLSGNTRITDEHSPVVMLGATPAQSALAPIFRGPNQIGAEDWDGWIQDRALYCPSTWGNEFNPLLAMNDPGEAPLRGCLLEAKVGRGSYVYSGLAFFRELPAGVPGAYRLFFNLLGGRVTP